MNLYSHYEARLKKLQKGDPARVHEFMMEAAPFIKEYSDSDKRQLVFNQYMAKFEGTPLPQTDKEFSEHIQCTSCSGYEIVQDGGYDVCQTCGRCCRSVIDGLTYKDEQDLQVIGVYSYKRLNHFREWLAQFQGLENTAIPDEVIGKVRSEMKKTRTSPDNLTTEVLRSILKKQKLTKYYERIPSILQTISGKNPLRMSPALEETLRLMFMEIQAPFNRVCPENRKNFLSYSYVLYKFCELLGEDEYLPCFPLLKSKEKLKECDRIWKLICADRKYEYIPTI